jgi:SAM-dependent methyltransferase
MRPRRLVFGEDAELYDRVRPSYPAELIDDLVALVGGTAHALDAAAGTGKAAVMLAERGLHGVAVEADAAMAAVARRNLAPYPRWRVDESDFEDWRPRDDDGAFDLVTVAQAWHWIDREGGTGQAERLLRPGGRLALLGYDFEFEDSELRRAIDTIYRELDPAPPARLLVPSEPIAPGYAFGEPIVREYRGEREYTRAEWIALQRTQSNVRILEPATREELLRRLAEVIDEHGGVYRQHYVCRLWVADRSAR